MFTVRKVHDKQVWEDFVSAAKGQTFLHSWNWGEFNKSTGVKLWRLGVYDDNGLRAVFLTIKIKARRGTFLFVPQGPVVSDDFEVSILNLNIIVDYLKELAKEEACDFIRISPAFENEPAYKIVFNGLGFRQAPIHMHAELMWLLDISVEEKTLLKNMRKTTRYSINKAERDGVRIIKSSNPDDVMKLNSLYKETALRHKFTPYSLDYLAKEFGSFIKDGQVLLFLAEYKGEIIASAMIIFYGGAAYYHHGASINRGQVPAAYLLQWEAIKEAKSRGASIYNFWGVAAVGDNHPWSGLTLFKKGFGGYSKEYLPAQDLPITGKYWLSFIVEKIRKVRRRL